MSDDPYDKVYPDLPREEVEPHAANDTTIASMLRHGLPLNRHMYISHMYRGEVPEPWTYEHEHEVHPIFRDRDAVKPE